MDAGRAWAAGELSGGTDDDDAASLAQQLQALGIPPEQWPADLATAAGPAASRGLALWAEHVPALEAFVTVGSQMRETGLDYAGAQAGLALAGIAVDPALWADIRLIEAGAVAFMSERRQP